MSVYTKVYISGKSAHHFRHIGADGCVTVLQANLIPVTGPSNTTYIDVPGLVRVVGQREVWHWWAPLFPADETQGPPWQNWPTKEVPLPWWDPRRWFGTKTVTEHERGWVYFGLEDFDAVVSTTDVVALP